MSRARDLWTMSSVAFLDESSMLHGAGHVYVFGLLLVATADLELSEGRLRAAAGRRERIHYSDSPNTRRSVLVELMRSLPVRSCAIARTGPSRAEERSRRRLLASLFETPASVTQDTASFVMESRGNALDLKDKSLIRRVTAYSHGEFGDVRHVGWRHQPLLWGADIVAGSVSRAVASGQSPPFPVTWM